MRSPRESFRTIQQGCRGCRSRGFTLLEVALVLLVAGLAFWLGLLLLGRGLQQRRADRFIADLETFAAAFQDYHRQQGVWPPSTGETKAVPGGMENFLRETNWSLGSPFGGTYGWVPPDSAGRQGAVTLTAFSPNFPLGLTRAGLLELDRRMDDGDPATGRFRTGFNGWPVYLAGDKP